MRSANFVQLRKFGLCSVNFNERDKFSDFIARKIGKSPWAHAVSLNIGNMPFSWAKSTEALMT